MSHLYVPTLILQLNNNLQFYARSNDTHENKGVKKQKTKRDQIEKFPLTNCFLLMKLLCTLYEWI